MRFFIGSAMCAALFSICAFQPAHASSTFIELDAYPADQFGQSGLTVPGSIDSQGNVVGYAAPPESGGTSGFIYLKHGSVKFAKTRHHSSLYGMNNHGAAVGDMQYVHRGQFANKAIVVGFDKKVTGFKVPGAGVYAGGSAINDDGEIVGYYEGTDLNIHGFVRDAEGNVAAFDAPNAGNNGDETTGTYPAAINASGWVAGYVFDNSYLRHGFIRDPSGQLTAIDLNAPHFTAINAINADGAVTGAFGDGTSGHGFVRAADGTVTEFDAIKGVNSTSPMSINSGGDVAGYVEDSAGVTHGFVRSAKGHVTVFDIPDLGFGKAVSTMATAINDKGEIVGHYTDASKYTHGFLRVP